MRFVVAPDAVCASAEFKGLADDGPTVAPTFLPDLVEGTLVFLDDGGTTFWDATERGTFVAPLPLSPLFVVAVRVVFSILTAVVMSAGVVAAAEANVPGAVEGAGESATWVGACVVEWQNSVDDGVKQWQATD
jgi:hypothetical protein